MEKPERTKKTMTASLPKRVAMLPYAISVSTTLYAARSPESVAARKPIQRMLRLWAITT